MERGGGVGRGQLHGGRPRGQAGRPGAQRVPPAAAAAAAAALRGEGEALLVQVAAAPLAPARTVT